jgi:hypothetical protein
MAGQAAFYTRTCHLLRIYVLVRGVIVSWILQNRNSQVAAVRRASIAILVLLVEYKKYPQEFIKCQRNGTGNIAGCGINSTLLCLKTTSFCYKANVSDATSLVRIQGSIKYLTLSHLHPACHIDNKIGGIVHVSLRGTAVVCKCTCPLFPCVSTRDLHCGNSICFNLPCTDDSSKLLHKCLGTQAS